MKSMAMAGGQVSMMSSSFGHRRLKDYSFKSFFFVSSGLAFLTCFSIFFYISWTSELFNLPKIPNQTHLRLKPPLQMQFYSIPPPTQYIVSSSDIIISNDHQFNVSEPTKVGETSPNSSSENDQNQRPSLSDDDEGILPQQGDDEGNNVENLDVYHERDLFMQEYKEMNRSFKIFVYPPHQPKDPFANLLLPEKRDPGGNYASESYFKKNLFKSHFITKNPSEAHLFYLPFSIASMRNDKRIGVGGIKNFIRDYIFNISHDYPYWNRTGGADHFYVACHSVGRAAMEKAIQVKTNAIQVVCSSSYFLTGYVSHKDASIPQIWPRKGRRPIRAPSQRKKLAFYAGAMNSKERQFLVKMWGHDTEISVHRRRLRTPYSEALLGSKFCLHAKGFEVNTARIGDALYYGCVPVILADYYDLPFADILNWERFAVVMMTMDIPMLKKILAKEVSSEGYLRLQSNVMEVQKHFQWHGIPIDYDAFYMAMYELWLRRSHLRLAIS